MAKADFRLTVEVDQDKVDALDAAEEKMRKLYEEFSEACIEVRRAIVDLRHSLKVKSKT